MADDLHDDEITPLSPPDSGVQRGDSGYGRPPKHGQFKKGERRAGAGRPPGSRSFKTEAREMLAMPVPISDGGRTRKVSTRKAALLKLREKALKGDSRALDRMIEMAREHELEDGAATTGALMREDAEVLERARQRMAEDLSLPSAPMPSTGGEPEK
jgi:uncharacterized membrane protein